MRVAVIGETIQNIYLIGESSEITKMITETGGGGFNAAVTLSRRGIETILLSTVSKDVAGRAALSQLDHEGIDSSYMQIRGKGTGTIVTILSPKTDDKTTFNYRGVSDNFEKFEAQDLELLQPDYLYASSLGGNMEKLLEFFEKAHEIGCKVVFHPGEKEVANNKKMLGILSETDILILNKKQAAKLVPGTILTELLYHLNGYVPIVIITDGAMGGVAGNRETGEIYRFGIYEDVEAIDHIGAGDAFASGFLAALSSRKNFRQSLVFASANATKVTQEIGPNTGVIDGQVSLHPMPIQKIS